MKKQILHALLIYQDEIIFTVFIILIIYASYMLKDMSDFNSMKGKYKNK